MADIKITEQLPFGGYNAAHVDMIDSDRAGERVEIRARGEWAQTMTVRGTIVGEVDTVSGRMIVVRHDSGSYQTYAQEVILPIGEGDDDTVPASELVDAIPFPSFYRWHGSRYVSWEVGREDLPAPVGGETVSYGVHDMTSEGPGDAYGDAPRYVAIPHTAHGEHNGASTVERSNYRSVLSDFPGVLVEVTGSDGFAVLMVRADDGARVPAELVRVVRGLVDYPVYDESDLSDLESEIEEDDWMSWGRWDLEREIIRLAREADDVNSDAVEDLLAEEDKIIDSAAEAARAEGRLSWEAETPFSGRFRGFDELTAEIYHTAVARLSA